MYITVRLTSGNTRLMCLACLCLCTEQYRRCACPNGRWGMKNSPKPKHVDFRA